MNLKYELSIKGMSCSYCSNKIESFLKEMDGVIAANVNLITEKAFIIIKNEKLLDEIKFKLSEMNYDLGHIKNLNKSHSKYRIMNYELNRSVNLDDLRFLKIEGIIKFDFKSSDNKKEEKNSLNIEYDPEIIKGHILNDKIKELIIHEPNYINSYSEITQINYSSTASLSFTRLIILILLTLFMMFMSMIDTKFHKLLLSIFIISPKLNFNLLLSLGVSSSIILLYGIQIYKRSFKQYKNFKILNMETLISLGSLASIFYTAQLLLKLVFIEDKNINNCMMMCVNAAEAASLILSITILGKYIEGRAKNNINKFTNKIFTNMSNSDGKFVTCIKPLDKNLNSFEEKVIDVGLLEKGDLVKILEKDFVLFDGVIVKGEVEIKENTTFGYDVIYKKTRGDKIKGGSSVNNGECFVMAENVLEDSNLFNIIKEMNSSLNQKLKFQNFIDSIMKYFVPFIILISFITFCLWFIFFLVIIALYSDDKRYDYLTFNFVVERAISVLVVSCPCAFGIAIPTVTAIALNLALKNGIIIKNLSALPEVRIANTIVFDKTGTLTDTIRNVKLEYISNEYRTNEFPIFEIIAHLEKNQPHPIAEAIEAYCMKNIKSNDLINSISSNQPPSVKSNGIEGYVKFRDEDFIIHIGNHEYIKCCEMKIDKNISNIFEESITRNLNICFVCVNKEIELVFSLDCSSDIREEASFVVNYLRNNMKKNLLILSGDHDSSVKEVGRKLGFIEENCIGDADNHMKKQFLNNLKNEENEKIIMIGDGVNDVLCLTEADFGISFNASSRLNLIAGDVILAKKDLSLIITLIKLSRLTYIYIWINIFWACIYNLCMLPITTGLFHYFWEMDMTPTSSSFSMLCSSLLIIITSFSLNFWNLRFKNIEKKVEISSMRSKINKSDSNLINNEEVAGVITT